MDYTCENCKSRNTWDCEDCWGRHCEDFELDESTLSEEEQKVRQTHTGLIGMCLDMINFSEY